MSQSTLITEQERHLLELTAELWNGFYKLNNKHPSDMEELQRDIHNIQHRIMARVATRNNHDLFTQTRQSLAINTATMPTIDLAEMCGADKTFFAGELVSVSFSPGQLEAFRRATVHISID